MRPVVSYGYSGVKPSVSAVTVVLQWINTVKVNEVKLSHSTPLRHY